MLKLIINGYNGKMGKAVEEACEGYENISLVAGIDKYKDGKEKVPVFDSLELCDIKGDVVIDFSNASSTDILLDACKAKGLSLVLCTTGLSDEQIKKVNDYSGSIAILRSANMSLGINVLSKLIQQAAKMLYDENFDIEIIEKHHNMKVDAPSGTAILLADAMNEILDNRLNYVYDRTGYRSKRKVEELGISSLRGGSIVGEHEIIFAGADEIISIKHEAFSRNIFAKGAIAAALFLAGKSSGLYSMKDVIA